MKTQKKNNSGDHEYGISKVDGTGTILKERESD